MLESWDLRDAAGADWRDFFNELASERAARPERTLVLSFGAGGEPLPGLFMVQRVFTAGWPESDTDPSWRTRLLLHIVNAVGRHNKAREMVARQGGARFDSQFEAEIARSALVAIRSDRYGGRPWCRWEVLRGKCHHRPLLVVDLIERGEPRIFPYAGTVAGLAAAEIERIVLAMLTEVLKSMIWRRRASRIAT